MKLRLSHKLISLFILIGLVPFILISFYAFLNSRKALDKSARDRLSFLMESRKQAISNYLETVRRQVVTQSESTMAINAMISFSSRFKALKHQKDIIDLEGSESILNRLRARYAFQEANTADAPKNAISLWWPGSWPVQYLQHLYISDNPYAVGEKDKLTRALDNSSYSDIHAKYHPIFRNFLESFGYYDIFLVNAENGHIVYSVFKELDFGTSLFTGPYADTNIGRVFKEAVASEDKATVFFADFEPYAPSYNQPAAFIASPVFDGDQRLGVLIYQLPIHRINAIMTGGEDLHATGLGETGDSMLIGHDFKFRSNCRPLIETPDTLARELLEAGHKKAVVDRVLSGKTAIGNLAFDKPIVRAALRGETGMSLETDYRGHSVLAGYTPLDTWGTRWAIVTTIDKEEAYASLIGLRRVMLILGILGVGAVLATGIYFARSISRPLNEIIGVLSSSSAEIAATVTQQETIVQQQAAAVQETNTTMEELGSSSKLTAEQAESAARGAEQIMQLSHDGSGKMEEMVMGMDTLRNKVDDIAQQILHLSEQTAKIGDITSLVSDFANETKMLAMNAAVEAVRAGEHGKGFSVLSVEIRKLADESKRSAERIAGLVEEIQKVTNATVMATEEGTKHVERGAHSAEVTSQTFDQVNTAVNTAAQSTRQISLNVQQQAIAVKQVVEAIGTLNQGARETTAGIGQVKEGIQTLNDAAQRLKEMV